MSTYLQLVNSAIRHSGLTLDELTSSTFASPDDPMYTKMKDWVEQSWREIQIERNEWQFEQGTYQGIIYPRLHVVEGNRSVAPPTDSIFEGDDTDSTFTVISTSLIDGTWAGGDAEAWINYSTLTGSFKWNEQFDETDPTPANTNVFRLKGWGRYDLVTDAGSALEIALDRVYIQSTGGSSVQTNSSSTDNERLMFIPWATWNLSMEWDGVSRGRPEYFTETPEGYFDFWPRPDEGYVITFDYTKPPETLSAYDDVPAGLPTYYHDIIYWRAIMKYAAYERDTTVYARAEKEHNFWKTRMERNEMPVIQYAPSRYDQYRL